MKHKFLPIVLFVCIVLFFFNSFILQGKLPIPSDTIVGLYNPFRDLYSKDYPNGIPFKNSLITDPVRQQYPWRELAIMLEKKLELPLWNPYNMSGTPLLANMQSGALYPLNILLLIFPFSIAWSLLIVLEPLLGGLFLYFYLNNLKINKWASFLGAVVFSFSGFSVAWIEWGTILHVALWLPLALLSTDKIFEYSQTLENEKLKIENEKLSLEAASDAANARSGFARQLKNKKLLTWGFIFAFSLVCSFFAGHLQIFFYLVVFSIAYLIARWVQYGKIFNILYVFFIFYFLFFILTAAQWIPTLQFILLSARNVDQIAWNKDGWFIPWQHLIQFVVPDFFGNPTTLNYWGVWNYGEFIGYVGIAPLIMAIFALFFRHDKKTFFFGVIFFLSLIFSLPTILGKLPYILNAPFLSTSPPTRLLFLTDFSLAVLAAFGFDYFIRVRKKEILYPLIFVGLILGGLWDLVIFGSSLIKASSENLSVARNNLILPTILLFTAALTIFISLMNKSKVIQTILLTCFLVIIIFDLLRFAFKFTPFTKEEYLFPQTKAISFLQKNIGHYRFMTTDSRIFPPNFSMVYRLQSVDGYDPLYLRRFGELIAVSERSEPNISPPFGFNRIITPHNYDSKIIDLLGVKYILSLSDLSSPKLKKVFQEGQTRVYENKNAFPRVFFVRKIFQIARKDNRELAVQTMFKEDFDLRTMAVVEHELSGSWFVPPVAPRKISSEFQVGDVKIVHYSDNKVVIYTKSTDDGFLVLTDSFYPSWHAKIDNIKTQIIRTDYNFRGLAVPKGKHLIELYTTLL